MRPPSSRLVMLLFVMVMAATAMAYTPTKDPAAVQLSPSVQVMGEYDRRQQQPAGSKPTSRCLDMVARARRYSSSSKLNFVVVHHWLPNSDGFGVSSYCYMHTDSGASPGAGAQGQCLPFTADAIAAFKQSMTNCFTEAFKQGFTPYIRPYLDDGAQRGVWRNGLLFSPSTKYGSYSYADVMIRPLAEALRDALAAAAQLGKLATPLDRARPVVYVALTGEMSATVMRFASDWAALFPVVKGIIGSSLADAKVGVGLNFNALDAVESQPLEGSTASSTAGSQLEAGMGSFWSVFGPATPSTPAVRYPSSVPAINPASVRDLLANKADFLGISAYYPYSGADFAPTEFEASARQVATDLARLAGGLDLASLAGSGKLELHYSEFGIGCGVDGKNEIAPSATACAQAPWAGIVDVFSPALNPWSRSDLAAFRRSFYSKAIDWLSNPDAGMLRIDEVFGWSMSSWDVLGLYPDSLGYRDLSVAQELAAHDTAVIAAQVCEDRSTQECDRFVAAHSACLGDTTGAACLGRADVVTEAGPAQTPSASPPATQPAGGAPEAASSPAPDSAGQAEMAPAAASAASPAPAAAAAGGWVDPSNPNIVFVGVQPAQPWSPTTNSAGGRHSKWAVPVVTPLLCVALMVL